MPRFSLKSIGQILGTLVALQGSAVADTGAVTDYDQKSAVIFAYFSVGDDDAPSSSVTSGQFDDQIEELNSGAYHVLPLPEIIQAFRAGRTLPDRTAAITFDGADKSTIERAVPVLMAKKLPFTVFIPASNVAEGKPPYMDWDDLRTLKNSSLVSFGLHPGRYESLVSADDSEIRRQINNSMTAIRKELNVEPVLFAYPFGEYNARYKKIVASMGFDAAFGQQSGAAYSGDDMFALPRFTLTESYGDMERFLMTANALPLPVKDISPVDPVLSSLNPVIGFTVPQSLMKSVKSLSCFSSSEEKPHLEFLNNRIEIRLNGINEERPRINCTLPVQNQPGEDPRWRWLGMMYSVPRELLEKAPTSPPQASEQSDMISVE